MGQQNSDTLSLILWGLQFASEIRVTSQIKTLYFDFLNACIFPCNNKGRIRDNRTFNEDEGCKMKDFGGRGICSI